MMDNRALSLVVSLACFQFFAAIISIPRAYAVGTAVLLLCSLLHLAKGRHAPLCKWDKALIGVLMFIFFTGLFTWAYHGNSWASFDLTTRYLLAIPIFLMLMAVPPKQAWIWGGFVAGSVSGLAVALWETQILDIRRADGFTGGIQFGDLGLMMAVFCAAGLSWARSLPRHSTGWVVALAIGIASGAGSSIMSGTRGGWVALPAIVLVFLAAYIRRDNLLKLVAVLAVLVAGMAILAVSVPMVQTRYEHALVDIRKFEHGNPNSSLGARFAMWESLMIIIPQKPLLGWSDEAYKDEQQRLIAEGTVPPIVGKLANTHNTFLELWVHYGLLGLLSVIALFVVSFFMFAGKLRDDSAAVRASAIAGMQLTLCYAIFSQTQIMLGRNNTLLFFILALLIFWVMLRSGSAADGRHPLGINS